MGACESIKRSFAFLSLSRDFFFHLLVAREKDKPKKRRKIVGEDKILHTFLAVNLHEFMK